MLPSYLRYVFRVLNKFFMVPLFRAGLGMIFGNPIWGYMVVLKTIGRKSGKTRYSPVNYAVLNGCVYCMAGWGNEADWYRNLTVNPAIEMIMPGGSFAGTAETVNQPEERSKAIRQVLKAGGLAGFLLGFNPFSVSDEKLAEATAAILVIRIRPTGLAVGAGDYGGWLWILVLLLIVILIVK
jgi:deazaflavin-dependent oxidoreductase (nitroreductase family)